MGKSVKVGDLGEHDYQIMNSKLVSIASVETPRSLRGKSEEEEEAEAAAAEDDDDDDDGANMSLAAMEAELRDGVMETLDAIATDFDVFRQLQDRLVSSRLSGKHLSDKDQSAYNDVFERIVANLNSLHLNNARIEALVEQLDAINKKLMGVRASRPTVNAAPRTGGWSKSRAI